MKCPDCGCEVYIKKHGRGIVKRRGKVIDVKDIEFIQCKKCGKYLNTEKIVDNLRILAEYMLQMEINERFLSRLVTRQLTLSSVCKNRREVNQNNS